MTVVNEVRNLDNILAPDEINFFRTNVPRFLDYMKFQQTLISQLIIRVGGSGPGTGVADLAALTERVETTETDVDQLENQDQEALISSLAGRVAQLESLIHDMQSDFTSDTRAIDAIEDLRRDAPTDRYHELLSRIEALEAQL